MVLHRKDFKLFIEKQLNLNNSKLKKKEKTQIIQPFRKNLGLFKAKNLYF